MTDVTTQAVEPQPRLITVPGQSATMEFSSTDDRGFNYASFFVDRYSIQPGYFIFGYRLKVSARVRRICARPSVAPRKTPKRNIKTRAGWRTKREAIVALNALNALLAK